MDPLVAGEVSAAVRPLFVVEADEYDTAFFDKRSKFVHYRPRVVILNNLEYDHADIFPDVAAIQRQFHHLVRTIPGRGRLIVNGEDQRLAEVLAMGCWTPVERFGFDPEFHWSARLIAADGSRFRSGTRDVRSVRSVGRCLVVTMYSTRWRRWRLHMRWVLRRLR